MFLRMDKNIPIKKDLDPMEALHQNPASAQNFDTLLYRVRPGDSLSVILSRYHPSLNGDELRRLIELVVQDNPMLKNSDHIVPDQLVRLRIPQKYCSAPGPAHDPFTIRADNHSWWSTLERDWHVAPKEDRNSMSVLLPVMIAAGSAKASMIETTFKTNAPLLSELVENYESYKLQKKTRGQYDYKRARLIERLTNKLGPTNLILNGTRPPKEVLRISRTKGSTPTQSIESQLSKMKLVSTLAKSGGVALSVVGLGMACNEIGAVKTRKEKNEIFVESGGSLIAGVAYGIGVSIAVAFFATPVGWVAGLLIGAGSAAAGYFTGRGAKALYDASGEKIDFVKHLRLDSVCKPGSGKRSGQIISNNSLSIL